MTSFTTTFRAVVAAHGDAVALREDARELTYSELAALAGGYRDAILRRGLRRGQVVVLQRERGIDATAAMIGILLAGGAYTVIGEGYPQHRLAGMLAALDVGLVLDADVVPDPPTPDAGRDVPRTAEDLMYVIFTSGTTSVPKAVGVPDRAVLRLLREPRLGLRPGRRITHLSTIEFDASVVELWGGLLSGMTVVCVSSRQVLDPFVMFDLIEFGADVMWMTSSLFNFFVDRRPEAFAGLERVIVGGEALSLHHVNLALPYVTVVNGYGPTENTVFTTLDVMDGASVPAIAIGTPVAGTDVLVVDEDGRPARHGELLALGDGLAVGYVNDPAKTAASFVDVGGRRAYRTGDHVTVREDGRLAFEGRVDSQVKVSGYRIDLQEVENAFLQCGAGTAKAFVDDGKVVVAVTRVGDALRPLVAEYLPAFMQPRAILLVDAIPLMPSGKADVRALRAATSAPGLLTPAGPSAAAPAPAATGIRELVAAHLGAPVPAEADNLFALGLDSIALWKVVAAVNDAHGLELSLFDVLDDPTISALEALVPTALAA
ncbi:non-ribosomal peptide synthetase [Phycicoccus flavus]|uniref:Non-ribosomal peptide synthetase n=1 Tax=Phycicoccus flavus TaxID=2502783 RepID=A0A8T6R239_9MICO|nr:non-ribosomal peptide synthetase [Phycicoccus flavus]NHA67703.1 non-ribosomal peptide synthetase [Phycicoccus flavus]